MIELRPLVYQIQNRKPGVEDMAAMIALQSAAREVFQRTSCWRTDLTSTMVAGTSSLTLAPPSVTVGDETQTTEILRIIRMEYINGNVVNTLPTLPSTTYTAGTTVFDLATKASYSVSSSNTWVEKATVWVPIRERSAQVTDTLHYHATQSGPPTKYTERYGTANFDLIPDYTYAVQARVALSPLDHFEVVDLPHERELMLVEGAMAQLWEFGEAKPQMADRARGKFLMQLQNFGADVLATNGQALMPTSALVPRRWR